LGTKNAIKYNLIQIICGINKNSANEQKVCAPSKLGPMDQQPLQRSHRPRLQPLAEKRERKLSTDHLRNLPRLPQGRFEAKEVSEVEVDRAVFVQEFAFHWKRKNPFRATNV
jgi:hypothetical protein